MSDAVNMITDYTEYETEYGDTFDSLAFRFYLDEQLSSVIIQANPDYCDVLIFEESVKLRIPIVDAISIPETLPPWRK